MKTTIIFALILLVPLAAYSQADREEKIYNDINNFDPTALGGLEIFGGKTLENLRTNPSASLLYVGMTHNEEKIQYTSFQLNSKITILEKEDPYYKFLLASRKLFEFDKFHLYQPEYPFGYFVNVVEVIDKSPWSRKPGGNKPGMYMRKEMNKNGLTRRMK